jgi:hypothetical protein
VLVVGLGLRDGAFRVEQAWRLPGQARQVAAAAARGQPPPATVLRGGAHCSPARPSTAEAAGVHVAGVYCRCRPCATNQTRTFPAGVHIWLRNAVTSRRWSHATTPHGRTQAAGRHQGAFLLLRLLLLPGLLRRHTHLGCTPLGVVVAVSR